MIEGERQRNRAMGDVSDGWHECEERAQPGRG